MYKLIKRTPFIFLFVLVLLSKTGHANEKQIETITQDKVRLTGIHLKQPQGEPILLIHGFMENTEYWMQAAQDLYRNGHDVYLFNMRGHGTKNRYSLPMTDSSPKMGFDEIVNFDIPSMVDFVYKSSGKKKIKIIGHSMGTMTTKLSASGVTYKNNKSVISAEHRKWMTTRIKAIIAFASPSGFEKFDPFLRRVYLLGPKSFLSYKKTILEILIPDSSSHSRTSGRFLNFSLRFGLISSTLDPLLKVKNLDQNNNEITKLFNSCVSVPHQDLFDDIYSWIQSNHYESRDGNVIYKNLSLNNEIPLVLIGATDDRVADSEEIIEDFLSQENKLNKLYIHIHGFGHMDLVYGNKGSKLASEIILNLINQNFNFTQINNMDINGTEVEVYNSNNYIDLYKLL